MIDSFRGYYGFLSNFSKYSTAYDGVVYPTSEHAYQAAKTLYLEERKAFLDFDSPRDAKKLGQTVSKRSDWESVKYGVMKQILYDKFSRHHEIRQRLLSTGESELVEGNTWHDNTWGNCSCDRCFNIEGKNLLGNALMEVRGHLLFEETFFNA